MSAAWMNQQVSSKTVCTQRVIKQELNSAWSLLDVMKQQQSFLICNEADEESVTLQSE